MMKEHYLVIQSNFIGSQTQSMDLSTSFGTVLPNLALIPKFVSEIQEKNYEQYFVNRVDSNFVLPQNHSLNYVYLSNYEYQNRLRFHLNKIDIITDYDHCELFIKSGKDGQFVDVDTIFNKKNNKQTEIISYKPNKQICKMPFGSTLELVFLNKDQEYAKAPFMTQVNITVEVLLVSENKKHVPTLELENV